MVICSDFPCKAILGISPSTRKTHAYYVKVGEAFSASPIPAKKWTKLFWGHKNRRFSPNGFMYLIWRKAALGGGDAHRWGFLPFRYLNMLVSFSWTCFITLTFFHRISLSVSWLLANGKFIINRDVALAGKWWLDVEDIEQDNETSTNLSWKWNKLLGWTKIRHRHLYGDKKPFHHGSGECFSS